MPLKGGMGIAFNEEREREPFEPYKPCFGSKAWPLAPRLLLWLQGGF